MTKSRVFARTIRFTRRIRRYSLGGLLLLPGFCLATEVQVVGLRPGQSVDVVIGDDAPLRIDVDETVGEIKVLRVDLDSAVLSINGTIKTLPLVPKSTSPEHATGSASVTLSADARGHFLTTAAVNGRSVRFLIDTGATVITLSRADARRIGLDYRSGTPTSAMTVNGAVRGWRVSLDSVRVGGMTVRDVEAIVLDADTLPVGLLGMSFLDRFDMRRDGTKLVLRQRR